LKLDIGLCLGLFFVVRDIFLWVLFLDFADYVEVFCVFCGLGVGIMIVVA